MAAKVAGVSLSSTIIHPQSYYTALKEIDYANTSRAIEAVIRDEDVRKLKFHIFVLEDENEDLAEALTKEEERVDELSHDLETTLGRLGELGGDLNALELDYEAKKREVESMRAELAAYATMNNDVSKYLKEKLALQSELSRVKPELEHLRSEAGSNRQILSEKLALQREISGLQVELDNAKRLVQRAQAKAGRHGEMDAELDAQIDDLRKQGEEQSRHLKDAKREVKRLQSELTTANAALMLNRQATADDQGDNKQLIELRDQLAAEKRERLKAERALEKEKNASEASKSILEDKLAQFRAKLRTTKEKLKETESELSLAKRAVSAPTTSNPRKRTAADLEPEAAIGTPGDGAPAKRGKKVAPSAPGDKSLFSITPFLSRTKNVAPESPPSGGGEAGQSAVHADTPTGKAAVSTEKVVAKRPLGPAPSTKQNANTKIAAVRNRAATQGTLEKVTEEDGENEAPVTRTDTTTTKVPLDGAPKLKSKLSKPRKSLADFQTFANEEAAEAQKAVVKKKRKLLGNNSSFLGKTLFDEDDEGEKLPPKPIPGRGLFGARILGKNNVSGIFGAKKGGNKAPLVVDEGFQFSPLKKDRRAALKAT